MPTLKKTKDETTTPETATEQATPTKKGGKKATPERPVVHPEILLKKCVGPKALTAEQSKEILGWEEEPDGVTFPNEGVFPELTPYVGRRVRLMNNLNNRPLEMGWVLVLRQELLQKRWRFNGSNLVIGNRNSVMQGQHRLIAHALADILLHSEREKDAEQREHWVKLHGDQPLLMETAICYGVEETDEVFQTLNRERPATAADTIFRSAYFAKYNWTDRRELSRMTAYAVERVWARTGANRDKHVHVCTPAEAMAFIDRHPRILKVVKHVWEENRPRKNEDGKPMPRAIGQFYSPGEASGLGYLMACSTTDPVKYKAKGVVERSEKQLDFEAWDRAEEFFTLLSGIQTGSPEFRPVLTKLAELRGEGDDRTPSTEEREALLIRAWLAWAAGSPPTLDDLDLSDLYVTDEKGRSLVDRDKIPLLGGIDTGGRKQDEDETEEESEEPADDPTPDEVADEADRIRTEKANGEAASKRKRTPAEHIENLKKNRAKKQSEARPE